MVCLSIQALDHAHRHVCVVCGPPEQKGASVWRLDLLGHQRMPPDKVQHIIRQRSGHVYAPGPQSVSYTLQEEEAKESEERRGRWASNKARCGLQGDIFGSFVIKFAINRDGWCEAERMSWGLARWSTAKMKGSRRKPEPCGGLCPLENVTFHLDDNEPVWVQQLACADTRATQLSLHLTKETSCLLFLSFCNDFSQLLEEAFMLLS